MAHRSKFRFMSNHDHPARREPVLGLTIDEQTSKDLDDAIWVTQTDAGYHIQVSITDVAAQVPLHGDIYLAAQKRAATQYRRSRNRPMLPRRLAEDHLSLLPQQQRLTLTFDLHLILLANSIYTGTGRKAANRETRVRARFLPVNQLSSRARLIAAAVRMCCRCVLPKPM